MVPLAIASLSMEDSICLQPLPSGPATQASHFEDTACEKSSDRLRDGDSGVEPAHSD